MKMIPCQILIGESAKDVAMGGKLVVVVAGDQFLTIFQPPFTVQQVTPGGLSKDRKSCVGLCGEATSLL